MLSKENHVDSEIKNDSLSKRSTLHNPFQASGPGSYRDQLSKWPVDASKGQAIAEGLCELCIHYSENRPKVKIG